MEQAGASIVLSVDSGIHSGVRHPLTPGRHVIGGDLAADIVLFGDGLEPSHVAITINTNGTARIEALGPDVMVGDRALAAGESVVEGLSFTIKAGGIDMACLGPAPAPATVEPERPRRSRLRTALPFGIAAVGLVALVALAPMPFGLWTGARAKLDGQLARPKFDIRQQEASLQTSSTARPGMETDLDDRRPGTRSLAGSVANERPEEMLRAELAALPTLRIEASADVISVRGTIEPQAVPRWEAAQQKFDARFGDRITLLKSVQVRSDKPPSLPTIEAVWSGRDPYVVVRGERYQPGARLDGGWIFRTVDAGKVILDRGSEVVAVAF